MVDTGLGLADKMWTELLMARKIGYGTSLNKPIEAFINDIKSFKEPLLHDRGLPDPMQAEGGPEGDMLSPSLAAAPGGPKDRVERR